jgi:RIC1
MRPYLFVIIGSPREFFYECLDRNRLTTTTSFLVVLHSMESNQLGEVDSVRLLEKLLLSESYELCSNLVRFLNFIFGQGIQLKLFEAVDSLICDDAKDVADIKSATMPFSRRMVDFSQQKATNTSIESEKCASCMYTLRLTII